MILIVFAFVIFVSGCKSKEEESNNNENNINEVENDENDANANNKSDPLNDNENNIDNNNEENKDKNTNNNDNENDGNENEEVKVNKRNLVKQEIAGAEFMIGKDYEEESAKSGDDYENKRFERESGENLITIGFTYEETEDLPFAITINDVLSGLIERERYDEMTDDRIETIAGKEWGTLEGKNYFDDEVEKILQTFYVSDEGPVYSIYI